MEKTLEKLNKYNIPYIDQKNILWKETPEDTISKGIYRDNHVIIKIYNILDYYQENNFYEEVCTEIYNYSIVKDCFHCCDIYGYSTYEKDGETYFHLILKDYGLIGDIDDYMNEFKFWTRSENSELNNLNYHYEVEDAYYYIYTLERDAKIKITLGICDAIEELHSKGMVHCDLKLENIIYDPKEKIVRLIDFGCSCHLKNEAYCYSDENMGTLGYMSEDISRGYITKRGDIYSLGVLVLELWVGRLWIEAYDEEGCYNEVLEGLTILRKKEPELSKIIKICLSKEIKDRPYIATVHRRLNKLFN